MKPNGRDCITDPVLKRLADSDHDALVLACRLRARSPHTEGFLIHDVHGRCEDNGSNQEHTSDINASQAKPDDTETVPFRTDSAPLLTEEQQASTAGLAYGRSMEGVFLIEPQSQEAAEVFKTTTTEGHQEEGITEAVTEGTMIYNELRGGGSTASVMAPVRRVSSGFRGYSSLRATTSLATLSSLM